MTEKINYPTINELRGIKARASSLGYELPINANLYKLGQDLSRSLSPRLSGETKLWRILKDARRRQAQWRAQERQKFTGSLSNPDDLSPDILRRASKIFVDLKERQASYGDYVFNFAIPQGMSPLIKIPRNLPNIIWKMAEYIEKPFPQGLPMARVDAIRQPDSSIKIIEINPCWVDNIGALQAFYETYQIPLSVLPVNILIQQIISRRPPNRNIALLYGAQADGCKRDEIYGLASYMESTGYFNQIDVSPITSRLQLKPYGIIYINGSFAMGQQYVVEEQIIEKLTQLQLQQQTLLLPAQFTALDSKISLVGMSQTRPDIFVKTTRQRDETTGPTIAKPLHSESLRGITTLPENPGLSLPTDYVYQPIITSATNQPLICIDNKAKTIFWPTPLYEKINIWIFGNKIAGVIATYDTTYMINDAGYNLPLPWQEI